MIGKRLGFLAGMAFMVLGMSAVHAATLTVTSNAPDTGDCNNPTDGTLRHAVCNAGPGDDTIVFDNDMTITLVNTLEINKNLTINGETNNITIKGDGTFDNVFEVTAGTVELSHLTIQDANAYGILVEGNTSLALIDTKLTSNVGGLHVQGEDGAIVTVSENSEISNNTDWGVVVLDTAEVNIIDSFLSDNQGTALFSGYNTIIDISGSILSGNTKQGIYAANSATLHINNSSITGNGEQGVYAVDSSRVTIENSTLSNNDLDGIYALGNSTITIVNSSISNNEDEGVYADDYSNVTIENSILSDNGIGGVYATENSTVKISDSNLSNNEDDGVYADENSQVTILNSVFSGNRDDGITIHDNSTVTIRYSTLSSNSYHGIIITHEANAFIENSTIAFNGSHGIGTYDEPTITLQHVTLANNSPAGLLVYDENTSLIIQNSIVADGCVFEDDATITDSGGNIDVGSTCGFGGSSWSNVNNLNLGPLADNGGPTHTLLPGAGSFAIDRVACIPGLATDQRGEDRPYGDLCDVGAVEVQATGGGGDDDNDENGNGLPDDIRPIPTLSQWGLLLLVLGIITLAARSRRRA